MFWYRRYKNICEIKHILFLFIISVILILYKENLVQSHFTYSSNKKKKKIF